MNKEEVIKYLQEHPEELKDIVAEVPTNTNYNPQVKKELFDQLGSEFDFNKSVQQWRIVDAITTLMRFALGIKKNKYVTISNADKARQFNKEAFELIKKYRKEEVK